MHPFLLNTSSQQTYTNNLDIFCTMTSPYGYWNQTERWGNQNGLTYMWPWVAYTYPGPWGPRLSDLAAGIFPTASAHSYTNGTGWAGVGTPLNTSVDADINWSTYPWNTSTGYIGMTFGATGFISATGAVQDIIDQYSWIPNKYRVFYPMRTWRAVNGGANGTILGISGSEYLRMKTGAKSGSDLRSPWLKRKINFVANELRAVYSRLSSNGFTMAHWEADDEYYYFYDYRSIGQIGTSTPIGDPDFLQNYVYPNNSANGNTWYATFTGICAAPDSLISEGITSMRSFLLGRGWTTNPSAFKYIDGITVAGYGSTAPANISASGSAFQFLCSEFYSDMADWTSYMFNDLINDFKTYNGLVANNSTSSNYGYYKSNVAVHDYFNPDSSHSSNFVSLTKNLTRKSTDYVPYKPPADWKDFDINNYYSFDNTNQKIDTVGLATFKRTGDTDNIHPYGEVNLNFKNNSYCVIDRNLDYRGGSYGFNSSGVTFGKGLVSFWIMWNKFSLLNSREPTKYPTLTQRPKKLIPANFLGTTLTQQLIELYSCAETMGNCAASFLRYDPTGVCGSTGCKQDRCGFDRAPMFVSWHLNPVWGITQRTFNGGATIGPANYVPIYGKHILNGITAGSITLNYLGTGVTTWSWNQFDPCGNILPGNTLPAKTLLKHYWTHWYPIAFMALLNNVKWGRAVAAVNVSEALYQRFDPANNPYINESIWNGIQKPISTWIPIQQWSNDYTADLNASSIENGQPLMLTSFIVPQGITYDYYLGTFGATGITFMSFDAGPMYYENIRHQYLNKTRRFSYWNPISYYYNYTSDGKILPSANNTYPLRYNSNNTSPVLAQGITCMGICGYAAMENARKINTILAECQTLGNGIVYETMYLAPVNMDERSYLASGAQLTNGSYLWRITFAHPATQSPIIVQGSVSGITTAYNVNTVSDFINTPNNKFGIWWTSNFYEIPIVQNPPVSEAERLGVVNLPENPAFVYNPLTMVQSEPRPEIKAYAWLWPGTTGTDSTSLSTWNANVNLMDNVSPLVFVNGLNTNDWKEGLAP